MSAMCPRCGFTGFGTHFCMGSPGTAASWPAPQIIGPRLIPPPNPKMDRIENLTDGEVGRILKDAGIDPEESLERLYQKIPGLRPDDTMERCPECRTGWPCNLCGGTGEVTPKEKL